MIIRNENFKQNTICSLSFLTALTATTATASVYAQQNATGRGGGGGIVELIGQQYFENGTGISYFSDNTSRPFAHSITPENGFYYNNSVTYSVGDVLGVNVTTTTPQTTGKVINNTIPYGASLLPANQTFQPNSVTVKLGDTIQFVNNDYQSHRIVSPPSTLFDSNNKEVASAATFDTGNLNPGDVSTNMTALRPGGYHYNDNYNEAATGTIIIVG